MAGYISIPRLGRGTQSGANRTAPEGHIQSDHLLSDIGGDPASIAKMLNYPTLAPPPTVTTYSSTDVSSMNPVMRPPLGRVRRTSGSAPPISY